MWGLGVGSCIATLHHEDEAKAVLSVPADHSAMVALSFGYPADDWVPNKAGGRKPLHNLVRWETW